MRTFALEPCSAEYYVDLRYPYLDRRLVEFALAIPLEQKVRNGQTRSIVRRALRGVLPEPIRVRTSKAGPDEAFHRAVIRNRHRLIRECTQLRTAEYGFVEPKRFENALVELCHGISTNPVQVMFTLSLELWLRTLEPRSEGAASQPHAALGKSSSEALCGVGGLSA